MEAIAVCLQWLIHTFGWRRNLICYHAVSQVYFFVEGDQSLKPNWMRVTWPDFPPESAYGVISIMK